MLKNKLKIATIAVPVSPVTSGLAYRSRACAALNYEVYFKSEAAN
jgi:hypothetical protein